MPDPCDKTIEWRDYERRSGVRIDAASLRRKPDLAPLPRKTIDQMAADLATKIDEKTKALNAAAYVDCGACVFLGEEPTTEIVEIRSEFLLWEERFELRDAEGNTISGMARYMVQGEVTIASIIHVKRCGPPLGDNPRDFEVASAEKPDGWSLHGASQISLLTDLWKKLPAGERAGLKLIRAGKPA